MTSDRSDEMVDLVLRRDGAGVRRAVAAAVDLDDAWAEFVDRIHGVAPLKVPTRRRRVRREAVVALAMTAAAFLAVVVMMISQDRPSDAPPISTPPSPDTTDASSAALVPVTYRPSGLLVALLPDGSERAIGRLPAHDEGLSYLRADVSVSGWVATSGVASEGFWFYDLRHPDVQRRWVPLAGPIGGHESRGTWNPDGTLYAAVEASRTAALIDPATGQVVRRTSRVAPAGYPPTWTEDGSGILIGDSTTWGCPTPDSVGPYARVVQIDGSGESGPLPDMAWRDCYPPSEATVNGSFAGFVPRSLVDSLPTVGEDP